MVALFRIPGRSERPEGEAGQGATAREADAVYATAGGAAAPSLGAARADVLFPGLARDFVLPFLLAALRPDARRWLGQDRMKRLAALLRLREGALVALLDTPPQPPVALSEVGPWTGRCVPLLGRDGKADWIELFWRPDRGQGKAAQGNGGGNGKRGGFAIRLTLPATGRIEVRGRLEGVRLDAVMETEFPLTRSIAADVVESFETALSSLRMVGRLTIGSANGHRRT